MKISKIFTITYAVIFCATLQITAAMDEIIDLNDENFEVEVLNSSVPVLVDFYAEWCGPCKRVAPILEDTASRYQDTPLKICKLNIDENKETASKYGIKVIPTVILFQNGNIVDTRVGSFSKSELDEFLQPHIE